MFYILVIMKSLGIIYEIFMQPFKRHVIGVPYIND